MTAVGSVTIQGSLGQGMWKPPISRAAVIAASTGAASGEASRAASSGRMRRSPGSRLRAAAAA
jgi:hypothetical protein